MGLILGFPLCTSRSLLQHNNTSRFQQQYQPPPVQQTSSQYQSPPQYQSPQFQSPPQYQLPPVQQTQYQRLRSSRRSTSCLRCCRGGAAPVAPHGRDDESTESDSRRFRHDQRVLATMTDASVYCYFYLAIYGS